jgi:hypothetical protein
MNFPSFTISYDPRSLNTLRVFFILHIWAFQLNFIACLTELPCSILLWRFHKSDIVCLPTMINLQQKFSSGQTPPGRRQAETNKNYSKWNRRSHSYTKKSNFVTFQIIICTNLVFLLTSRQNFLIR